MRRVAIVLAAVAVTAGACSPRTVGQPKGNLKVTATFDDAQDLRVGHPIQVFGVTVGTVTNVKLVGVRARVTMAIGSHRKIPRSSVAVLTRTSLLGEHIVDLRLPEGADPTQGPFLQRGDEVRVTRVEADLEQVTKRSIDFLTVLATGDLGAVLDAAGDAFGGRGDKLNRVIADVSNVADRIAAERGNLGAAIDGLGRLGSSLASNSDEALTLLDDVAATAKVLDANRDRFVTTADQLTKLATSANAVLGPHADEVRTLLSNLDGVLATLVHNRSTLEKLIGDQLTFVTNIEKAIHNGAILGYFWFVGTSPSTAAGAAAARTARPSVFSLLAPRP